MATNVWYQQQESGPGPDHPRTIKMTEKSRGQGVRETVQSVRALAAPAEDWGLSQHLHGGSHLSVTPASEDPKPLLPPRGSTRHEHGAYSYVKAKHT